MEFTHQGKNEKLILSVDRGNYRPGKEKWLPLIQIPKRIKSRTSSNIW